MIRLVCKSFNQTAVPFLFDEVFIAARYSVLDTAELVVSRFGSYLKTITLSFNHYEPWSMEEFRRETEIHATKKIVERIYGQFQYAFELYCRARTEGLELEESGEFLARICLVLSKSPNIRKMMLTDCGSRYSFPFELRPRDRWNPNELCPFKECTLSTKDHPIHYRPRRSYVQTTTYFHLAVAAVRISRSLITEIAVVHCGGVDRDSTDFRIDDAFEMTARQSCYLKLQLRQLTKLRIRLNRAQDFRPDISIARALCNAVNLESLFLCGYRSSCRYGPTMMTTSLGGCHFPKLKSLILQRMDSAEEDLMGFLQTSPHLRHLTFDSVHLVSGSFESLADNIRRTLRLKSVFIHYASNVAVEGGRLRRYFTNDPSLIEDFFLRNGENPFTKKARRVWKETDDKTRQKFMIDFNIEDHYRMYH